MLGRRKQARKCYDQVLALAPRSAPLLLRAANFYFQIGENNKALPDHGAYSDAHSGLRFDHLQRVHTLGGSL